MSEIQKSASSSGRADPLWIDMLCRNCGRCVRVCPAGIDIPSLLIVEERISAGEDEQAVKTDCMARWKKSSIRGGQPIDCIECGICSKRCPQGFHLLEIVRKYAMKQSSEYAAADSSAVNEK